MLTWTSMSRHAVSLGVGLANVSGKWMLGGGNRTRRSRFTAEKNCGCLPICGGESLHLPQTGDFLPRPLRYIGAFGDVASVVDV